MELKSIFSEGTELKIADKVIKINTITMGDIPVAVEIVSKISDLIPELNNDKKKNAAIFKFISTDFNSVISLLKVTTDLSEADIKKLNPAAGALVIAAVIKENASFFAQYVAPVITEATKGLGSIKSKN